jgi:hypothetical protein
MNTLKYLKFLFLSLFTFYLPTKVFAFSCDNITEIPKIECEALVAFYDSTNGNNWDIRISTNMPYPINYSIVNWKTTNTPCNWSGIFCDNKSDLKAGSYIVVVNPANGISDVGLISVDALD